MSKKIIHNRAQRIATILQVADTLLVENGYHSFSMRKVAAKAKISVGNLQYYFPTKDSLLAALLDMVIQGYIEEFESIAPTLSPKERFVSIIESVYRDLSTKRTTRFFPELWCMSNHDEQFSANMDVMYSRYRKVIQGVICQINPRLTSAQSKRLALFISSSIEGHTVFLGYKKPWTKETESIINISIQSFLWLIEQGSIPDS